MKNCPKCNELLVFPRESYAYCEDCGWPDEDFDDVFGGRDRKVGVDMGVVQERVIRVSEAKGAVKQHCMCAKFKEDAHYYIVFFPPGFFPDGVRAAKDIGAALALDKMLAFMERTWAESYP